MSTIALKAVIAAGTGTGKTFSAYNMAGPLGVFREDAPVAAPGFLALKRVEPKSTKDYAGAARGEVKLTRQVPDALGRLWPAVFTVTTSLPAFMTDAAKAAFVTEGILASQEAASQDALSKLVIPQS